jgi:hypothetical protein
LGAVDVFLLPLVVVEIIGAGVFGGGLVLVGSAGCLVEVILKPLDRTRDHFKLLVIEPQYFGGLDVVQVILVVFPLVDGSFFHVEMSQ